MVENEIKILRRVKHEHIVELIEEYETPKEIFLVMELLKVGVLLLNICERFFNYMLPDFLCLVCLKIALINSLNKLYAYTCRTVVSCSPATPTRTDTLILKLYLNTAKNISIIIYSLGKRNLQNTVLRVCV